MQTKSFWKKRSVVIRTRSWYETCDLALRVAISQWKPLTLYFVILAAPILAFDYAIWFGLFPDTFLLRDNGVDGAPMLMPTDMSLTSQFDLYFKIASLEYLLILFETPFMGSLVTQYLGKRLFISDRQISFKEVWISWRERLLQSFLLLVVLRFLTFFFFNAAEVIQLERLPLIRRKRDGISLFRRLRQITRSAYFRTGFIKRVNFELFNLSAVFTTAALFWRLTSLAIVEAHWQAAITFFLYLPLIFLGAAYFTTVYKFFYYINLRVQAEGWDVNLALQVEGEKLSEDLAKSQAFGQSRMHGSARAFMPLEIIETASAQLNEQLSKEDTP